MFSEQDQTYMAKALALAERGRLSVSPNPMVGCVIVKQGHVIGEGYHERAGGAHAEIIALANANADVTGATAYITLEPCCHTGKTPPCTESLIKSGIKQIMVACEDPNPHVKGKGIAALKAAGIEVMVGLMKDEATQLNEYFFHFITHKRPFVIAKWAMSLDGKTITHPSDDRQISSDNSRIETHQLRQQVDAIMVGANTARSDNPMLTARIGIENEHSKQPLRIIVSTNGELPHGLTLFQPTLLTHTLVATTNKISTQQQQQLSKLGVEIMILPSNQDNQVHLGALLDELGKRNIISLLVEGGMTLHHSFFRDHLINKIQVFIAPVLIGNQLSKTTLMNMKVKQIDRDISITSSGE